jgi:eukaryotic-like serine/threonine-protein kinase
VRWISDDALRHLREVADRPDLSGTRYELVETIGRGGMGTVWLARDRDLDREVALKVVHLSEGDGEEMERMLREARILARLEHPGIVPVHDVGVLPDGRVFYAMKRVRGSRLDEHARTLPVADRLRAFERICEAVAFAHAHGVIHRDLKPENVMVGPFGEVLVLDWGVAKDLTPWPPLPSPVHPPPGEGERIQSPLASSPPTHQPHPPSPVDGRVGDGRGGKGVRSSTAHGTVLGTPGYMAPEQARGEVERIDERTDVYALGAILAFLLAGEEPVPRPLEAIRRRAMAEAPEERYPSVQELAADLSRYLAGLSVSAHREGLLEQMGRFVRRYRTPILLILAYLLVRVLLIVLLGR